MNQTLKSDTAGNPPPSPLGASSARTVLTSCTPSGVPFYLTPKGPTTHNNNKKPLAKVFTMKQRELPVMSDIKRANNPVPQHLIELCQNKQEAIRLCINWSGIQVTVLAELLGIDKGNFTRILSGSAYLPPNKENLLQDICGNEAILEWSCYSRNKKPIPVDSTQKIAELEAQLMELKHG